AEMGNRVCCVDTDAAKIASLKNGIIPIYEPGLEDMVKRNVASGDLRFSTEIAQALPGSDLAFIAVGTPMGEDGSADLKYVLKVAEQIGMCLDGKIIVVDKSTVPVGTADRVRARIAEVLKSRVEQGDVTAAGASFDVVSNPEFLKEGTAVADFMRPDRVVVGADSVESLSVLETLYEPFVLRDNCLISMDIRSAELTKYASNAMLATRISFMNEIGLLCESVGANASKVRMGMGADRRIGPAFLYPGCGYGGSCFPKDIQALLKIMKDNDLTPILLEAVEQVNARQKKIMYEKVVRRFGENLSGRTFALWGLAFKPNTDDMRQAPSIPTVMELLARGARVNVFDPKAFPQAQECYFRNLTGITYSENKYDALSGADALLLMTEWSAFRSPDFDEIKARLKQPVIFDGRNQFERFNLCECGFEYYAIGIPGTPLAAKN
ncbi:MAG: UDP-glucose/GDP-mannose dehydrogenase family protein, partial [Thermoguttaceae bacterium]|nr:UDP-glucose/GDP-mannose dehydrogenase family protein [Thermoguttaceae bacterium]